MIEIDKKEIFNSTTLNIFTDASVKINIEHPISCSGYQSYLQTEMIDQNVQYLRTSNPDIAELNAIKMGILSAIRLRELNPFIESINLFSDSKNCITWLKELIFKWTTINNSGYLDMSKIPYKHNKSYLIDIIDLIIYNKLEINFYYVKGHSENSNLSKFKNSFMKINELSFSISNSLAREIIKNNTSVDNMVYTNLLEIPENRIQKPHISNSNSFGFIINTNDYKNLINKKGVLL